MGSTFARDLYYGRIAPWEHKRSRRFRQEEMPDKMEKKRADILGSIPEKSRRQLEELEKLYASRAEREKVECFRQGLKIGALFMETICREPVDEREWF